MKKHVLYCNPDGEKLNFEKPYDIKNLPSKIYKYGRCKITVEKYVPMKSLKQLGYYWSGVLPFLEKTLFDDTGMSKDDWHNELKNRFGIKEEDKSGVFTKVKSHAKYTEKEMSFFINQVVEWVLHFFNMQVPPATVIGDYI